MKNKKRQNPAGTFADHFSLRTCAAVAGCKASRMILRGLRRGGTALPGKVAMRFREDILSVTSAGMEVILVTGTNGKTTTAGILEHALERSGRDSLSNRSGANLLSGVTAEFVSSSDWRGRPVRKYAVIECDEGALHQVAPLIKPKVIVVTNLFRDQLDRYGEVMHTLEAIREGIREAPEAVLCLNADDSLTASLADDVRNPVLWFGMEEGALHAGQDETDPPEKISDARYCIRCGTEYHYRFRTFAHLGGFYCPKCGYARQTPDVAVTSVDSIALDGSCVHMRLPETEIQTVPVRIALPALYNIYNAAAAVCAYRAAGLPVGEILEALPNVPGRFGRMETFDLGGVHVRMILVKNPAGCGQALEYVCGLNEPCTVVLCLNDLDADGHDISWIWDVDYEKLCSLEAVRGIYVWGRRAEDLQLRLKYAGADESRIERIPEKEMKKLMDIIRHSEVPVFVLPNYTTMLPLRDALRRAAGKEAFWKG